MIATVASGSSTKEENKLSATAERFCHRFSLAEVQLATRDFSEAHLIGTGGFGVYVSKPVVALSWAQRVKIALGAAEGLEYIHEKALIHRNIKSKNILVYNDEVVKLADFGLSAHDVIERPDKYSEDYPYRANILHYYHPPEYIQDGELSWRSDVYSFGLVLIQLLTGRELVDRTRPKGQHHLVTWATPKLWGHRVKHIVDARLNGEFPLKAVVQMAEVTALCVQYEPEFRPKMCVVVMAPRRLLKDCSAMETKNHVSIH